MKLSRGFRVGRTGAPTIWKGYATQGTFSWGYYKPTKKTQCILKIHKWIVVCPASLRSGNFPCARAAMLTAWEHRDGSLGWDPGWRCQRLVQHIALEILRALIQKPVCLPWAEKSLEVSAAGMRLTLIFSSFRSAAAKAGGWCPPLAMHPLFIKPQRLKRNHFEHWGGELEAITCDW